MRNTILNESFFPGRGIYSAKPTRENRYLAHTSETIVVSFRQKCKRQKGGMRLLLAKKERGRGKGVVEGKDGRIFHGENPPNSL